MNRTGSKLLSRASYRERLLSAEPADHHDHYHDNPYSNDDHLQAQEQRPDLVGILLLAMLAILLYKTFG